VRNTVNNNDDQFYHINYNGLAEGLVTEVLMMESKLSDTTTKKTRATTTELAKENCLVKKNRGAQARKHNLDHNNNIDAVANSEASG
jgi:hypothetical protein